MISNDELRKVVHEAVMIEKPNIIKNCTDPESVCDLINCGILQGTETAYCFCVQNYSGIAGAIKG